MFNEAITSVYNIDPSFASTLSGGAIAAVANATGALDLRQLSTSDSIEHPASLTRLDKIQGNNNDVNQGLVQKVLADAEGNFLTASSLAKSRARREAESEAAGSESLGLQYTTLAYGEAALILKVLGKGEEKVPKADAETWLGKEQLPAGYTKPAEAVGAGAVTALATEILALATADSLLPDLGDLIPDSLTNILPMPWKH